MSYFSDEQVTLLLKPIHPQRVLQRDGMSYVEGYDVCAELNRIFGFGRWDVEVTDQVLLREAEVETKNKRAAWYVVYRSRVRLTVKAPDGTPLSVQEATHVGESTHPVYGEAHGNAVTNSETYALKRCAKNFGDQFGLSLYNKGSIAPLVRWTLVRPEAGKPVDTDDVPQVSAEQPDAGQPDSTPVDDTAGGGTSGWETRIAAAATAGALKAIEGDLRRLYGTGQVTAADANQVKALLDARAAEISGRQQQPEDAAPDAGAEREAEFVRSFAARTADAGETEVRSMRIALAKAVSAKVITPETANELGRALTERMTQAREAA